MVPASSAPTDSILDPIRLALSASEQADDGPRIRGRGAKAPGEDDEPLLWGVDIGRQSVKDMRN